MKTTASHSTPAPRHRGYWFLLALAALPVFAMPFLVLFETVFPSMEMKWLSVEMLLLIRSILFAIGTAAVLVAATRHSLALCLPFAALSVVGSAVRNLFIVYFTAMGQNSSSWHWGYIATGIAVSSLVAGVPYLLYVGVVKGLKKLVKNSVAAVLAAAPVVVLVDFFTWTTIFFCFGFAYPSLLAGTLPQNLFRYFGYTSPAMDIFPVHLPQLALNLLLLAVACLVLVLLFSRRPHARHKPTPAPTDEA